jgi:predicted Holliday junction resolvase-like endonuclease
MMSEMQFSQALIVILLVALFAVICWLAVLLHELTRSVRAAAHMIQDKLTANYEVVQKLVTELEENRDGGTARDKEE